MARSFDGTGDEINLDVNDYAAWGGGLTMAALFSKDATGAWGTIYNSRASGPTTLLYMGYDDVNRPSCMIGNNNEQFIDGWTLSGGGQWYLWIITKASGTVLARLHQYNGSAWQHDDFDVSRPDPGTAIATIHCIGAYNSAVDRHVGGIGLVAVWAGPPSSNNDASIEAYGWTTLAGWRNYPNTQQFYTETLLDDSGLTAVNDTSPINNDQTSVTGTATGATLPAWFDLGTTPAVLQNRWIRSRNGLWVR
jgi:hypothetical protein